jgi:DNA-binding CsgD family transcriptional regulator
VIKITGSRNDGFSKRYACENLSRIDPFIRRAATYLTPFTWQQVANDEADNDETQYFIQTCKDHGMADGIVIPSHGNDGTLGIVTFKGKGVSTDVELHPYLHQLGVYYRAGIKRIEESHEPKLEDPPLTPRQLQCIQWIAAGKSDWEIAEILGLSQFTVNRHVELAKQRLGFSSRIQVVVHALTAGLIAV